MSGQAAEDRGAWVANILDDICQSSCDAANLRIQLKRIKSVAKRGDSHIDDVFIAVWEALRSQNSMVRARAWDCLCTPYSHEVLVQTTSGIIRDFLDAVSAADARIASRTKSSTWFADALGSNAHLR